MDAVSDWIDRIIQKVQNLPISTAKDQSQIILMTETELREIIKEACDEINLRIE